MSDTSREQKLKLYLAGANNILHELRTSSIFSMYSGEFPTSGKIEFKNDFISSYFNPYKHNTFIHYTSLNAFNNIINSASIRMYNCDNMNDPRELKEGLSNLNIKLTENEITKFKSDHFIFSASKFDIIDDKDEFLMWRLYGNEGNGVALVFEFENIEDEFTGFFNGFVEYESSSDKIEKVKEFINYHNAFQEKHLLFQNNPSLFANLSLYVKNKIWSNENEYRILAYCSSKSHESGQNPFLRYTREDEINKNSTLVSYVSLPLNFETVLKKLNHFEDENMKKDYMAMIPKLKLKKVIYGYQLSDHQLVNLGDFNFNTIPSKLGYNVAIERSHLHEYFK